MITEELERAIFDLKLWQTSGQDFFTIQLYSLMGKADKYNFEKLKSAFPVEGQAFEMWRDSPDSAEFFKTYLG